MFEDLTGPELAAAIAAAAADPAGLSAGDALDVVVAAERLIGWAHAVQADATLRLLDSDRAPVPGFDAAVEIGAALGASIRTGSAKATFAYGLSRLPVARERLLVGQLSLSRARRLITETQSCDDETAAEVDRQLSPQAAKWSVAELGRRAARLIGELDPDGLRKRHERKRAERSVEFYPDADGMGWLSLYGPTDDLAAAYTAINDKALQKRRAGDESPMGLLRFAAAIDLLTGRDNSSASVGVLVRLTVPVQTILGLADAQGDIDGAGPIPASVARKLAAGAEIWERILTDPATGAPHSHDRRRYRPTEAMRKRVMDRDQHCRAAGCDAPVWRCDADHDIPWPDGPTCECNLTTFCRRHHNAKTHGGWTTTLAPDGTLTIISPLGRVYATCVEPRPHVADLSHTGESPPEELDDESTQAEHVLHFMADPWHLGLAA